jgi:hypothetical protein
LLGFLVSLVANAAGSADNFGMRYESQLRSAGVLLLAALVFLVSRFAFDLIGGGPVAALGAVTVAVVAAACFLWALR